MKYQILVKPRNWITIAILATAALVAGSITIYSILRYRSNSQTPQPALSASPVRPKSVAALGYLEPKGEVIKVSAPAFKDGTRVSQLLVKLGETVKAGQTIAILDSRDRLQAVLTEAQAQVQIAQSRLAQVKAGNKRGEIKAQDARFQRTKAELEGQINTQKATISSLQAQREGEQSAQKAIVERIKFELDNANKDCRRYQTLYQDGAVSEQQREQFCLQAKTTEKNLAEAQANFNRIVITFDEKIKEAQANLERTRLTLKQQIQENQSTLEAVEEVRPVDVQVAQAELISAKASVKRAQEELELAYVKSPKDGQILKIHTWPGELVGTEGIVDLGQTQQMYVTAEVYETDINYIRLGQKARIKTNSTIGDLEGNVAEIGLLIGRKNILGTDPVADADARVLEVKIRLTPSSSQKVASLTNLEVNVVIDTANSANNSP